MAATNMDLFIHTENQTLLWNLLQESPYWKPFSATTNVELWFRDIVCAMHELHPQVLTYDELKKVNSEMVSMCSKRMKSDIMQLSQVNEPANSNCQSENVLAYAYDVEKQREAKLEAAKKELEEFQNQYYKGLERPTPPALNLAINIDEPKITDMEKLVKQHLESRNALQIPSWEPLEETKVSSKRLE